MAILRAKDENGDIIPITAIKGDKGEAGAGIHVGSYVGTCPPVASSTSQYVDLGSPHAIAVLLQTDGSLLLVTAEGVEVDGVCVATLISGTEMSRGDNMFLAVHYPLTNQEGVTYHYIAFVEEATE